MCALSRRSPLSILPTSLIKQEQTFLCSAYVSDCFEASPQTTYSYVLITVANIAKKISIFFSGL
jgi:hypothetical protein